MDKNEKNQRVAPYVSPGTFVNFLDSIRATALPSRIDRSVGFLNSKSGTIQGQLLHALEFLGLISEIGEPTRRMEDLVNLDGGERDECERRMLQEAYPYLFEQDFNLKNATTQQIAEKFREHGNVSGATVSRAVSLFIKLANRAGIEISPHIKPSSLRPQSRKPPKRDQTIKSERRKQQEQKPDDEVTKDEPSNVKTVELPTGGWVKLFVTAHDLLGDDRDFMERILQLIKEFEERG